MARPCQYNRSEVLQKSVDVFWNKGFKDTSLQDLEKATGVNKSGLYSEFKDKDDLFVSGLRAYIDSSGVFQILESLPLGWNNIEHLLLAGNMCETRRGCIIVNSVREFSILPKGAKILIQSHLKKVQAAVQKNVQAADSRLDAHEVAQLILTFNSGMCLAQNMGKMNHYKKQIRAFLNLLKGNKPQ